jgi:hypothetical protein
MLTNKLHWMLQAVASVLLLAFGSAFICFMTAGSVMVELLNAGVPKYISLSLGILTALGCYSFIVFNHKLRDFIQKTRGV